jgi:plasmid replication initiation protein
MERLLPVRHPNRDFFACDIFEALTSFKDDMASMEHPVFSLATKPDMRVLHYEHNGNTITIKPSYDGLATIHDKDILLYCASYLRAAINRGETPSRTVRFNSYDFFVSTNRATDGDTYQRFKAGLERLSGTRIQTNIKTGGLTIEEGFGLVDAWRAVKEDKSGRVIAAEIRVSDWFYNSILANELLTINRDYFRIRKPIERRIYEIARKHCGDAPSFKIGLDKLHKKIGSTSPLRKLRFQMQETTKTNHLPDYEIALSDDMVTFTNRNWKEPAPSSPPPMPLFSGPLLKLDTYAKARAIAPGWDVYALEQQWREWIEKKGMPKRPDGAFIGFCKKKGPCP